MINGDINEFMDKLLGGEELIYTYNGNKYFSQGYNEDNGEYVFELQLWEPEVKLLWQVSGKDKQNSLNAFLKEPLFEGKIFGKWRKKLNG